MFKTRVLIAMMAMILLSCQVPEKKRGTLPAPIADVHMHYNWNQEEVISPREVIARLKKQRVVLAVVFSRPSDNALKLRKAGGKWVIPFFSPYYKAGIKMHWYRLKEVLVETRKALASGRYYGIGELHLVDGMGPRRDNPVVQGLFKLAAEFNVPVNIHTDSSRHGYFLPICRQHSKVRFIWAHAGGVLGPGEVGKLMQACPNVWVELSARDPWHYGGITDNGRLLPEWLALFKRYPARFMMGTDPVWNAHQTYRWYEADEGWFHYRKLVIYHRQWLKQLPAELARMIRIDNARAFFRYALK